MAKTKIVHTYKDRLFRKVFSEKDALLSLYNALNGTDYKNEEDLEINTLEDVIYMGFKNDCSFLIDTDLSLYEAQSTWNPNMPLRGLFYFAKLYQGYVTERNLDPYSKVLLKIPTPKYIVFYDGVAQKPEKVLLRLSSSFLKKDPDCALECTATVLNINYGYNRKLMENCRKLYEYSAFIKSIREELRNGLSLHASVNRAIDRCIDEGILKDFLAKHRAEVTDVILTEYNEELHIRSEKKISFEEGLAEGRATGISEGEQIALIRLVCRKFLRGKTAECIAEELEENPETIIRIIEAARKYSPDYDPQKIYEGSLKQTVQ